jgi:hypothetical protein
MQADTYLGLGNIFVASSLSLLPIISLLVLISFGVCVHAVHSDRQTSPEMLTFFLDFYEKWHDTT